MRIAATPVPIVTAGSTRWPAVPYPETGKSPSPMEKTRIGRGPSQKWGIDRPSIARNPQRWSRKVCCLIADTIPRGNAMQRATVIEAAERRRGGGTLRRISRSTRSPRPGTRGPSAGDGRSGPFSFPGLLSLAEFHLLPGCVILVGSDDEAREPPVPDEDVPVDPEGGDGEGAGEGWLTLPEVFFPFPPA